MSITCVHVGHTYMSGTAYERVALDDINLTIEPGEIVGIIGHTGSGKSTLIQTFNGLLKPIQGTVTVDGVNPTGRSMSAKAARAKVGMVFQYPEHQLFAETVYDDVAFGPHNLEQPEEMVEQRVVRALEAVGLDVDALRQRSPFSLSGGQMRRVAIAGVLAMEPQYLIMDEPSAGLDPYSRQLLFQQIRDLHQRSGMAVVLVTHNMEEVAAFAQKIVVLHRGKILLSGTPAEVFSADSKRLNQAGIELPQITQIARMLKAGGLPIRDNVYTIDEAAEEIYQVLKGESGCSRN